MRITMVKRWSEKRFVRFVEAKRSVAPLVSVKHYGFGIIVTLKLFSSTKRLSGTVLVVAFVQEHALRENFSETRLQTDTICP